MFLIPASDLCDICPLFKRFFGQVIESTSGRQVPTRVIAERHIVEDLGTIPTLSDWLRNMNVVPWIRRTTPERQTYRTVLTRGRTNDI